MVMINCPELREMSSSRYRLGMARRPFASRLIALAPRNTDAFLQILAFYVQKTHFVPLSATCAHYRNAPTTPSRRGFKEKPYRSEIYERKRRRNQSSAVFLAQ